MYDAENESLPAGFPASPPGAPIAQPAGPFAVARPMTVCFPQLASRRSSALADVAIVACFSLAFLNFMLIWNVPETLLVRWPEVGIMGVNAMLGTVNLLLVGAVLLLRKQGLATLGITRSFNARTLLWTAVAVPGCYVGSIGGVILYSLVAGFDTELILAEKTDLADLVATIPMHWVFPFALFVGIHEEILFRGFYLSRVRAMSRSGAAAILATSVAFGVLHYYQGLLGIFQTFAVGLVLAIIVTWARSLWPAVIAHAAFDATNMLLLPWLLKTAAELNNAASTSSVFRV